MPEFEIPYLEGYISVSETAERLGVSRQAVHKMARSGKFTSARRVPSERRVAGAPSNEHIIFAEKEVKAMALDRAQEVVEPPGADDPVAREITSVAQHSVAHMVIEDEVIRKSGSCPIADCHVTWLEVLAAEGAA